MEENVSTANRVFLVEHVHEIEDYYRVPRAERVFTTREVAQAWVDAKVAADALLTSPEVKAKSDERRRSHAMMNLEKGVSRFQELGWDEERIVAEVRRIFAE